MCYIIFITINHQFWEKLQASKMFFNINNSKSNIDEHLVTLEIGRESGRAELETGSKICDLHKTPHLFYVHIVRVHRWIKIK